ncbi:MAG: transposase family protein [Clostridia bacterium]|nr:transposase family protein [Clostridia bacterium]
MIMRNPEAINPATLPNRKSPWKTVEEEQAARQSAAEAQLNAWRAILPGLLEKFARLKDPRRPGSIRHKLTVLMVFGLLLFVFQYSSRREANRELSHPGVLETLRSVFPEVDSTPHLDTLARLLEKIPAEQIENILRITVRKLLRNKKLQALLVEKRYVVAIDGTQKFTRTVPFAPEALHRKSENYVYLLEAVLVGPQGIVIPLLAEFCENDQDRDKQDCELKAFRRLAARLKELMGKLPLLIVADGLYPNGPVMQICRQNNWDFMIVLPSNCLKSVWEDAFGIHKLEPEQTRTHQWGDRTQNFWWANGIVYVWRDAENQHHRLVLHVVVCNEAWEENGLTCQATWAWVSGTPVTRKNVINRCNRAARHRWGIEENFLIEKRHGYNYEHPFSYDWNALKGWHALMRLAHLINILTLHTVALWETVQTLGMRGTLRFLWQTFTGNWLDISRLSRLRDKPAQLRLVI